MYIMLAHVFLMPYRRFASSMSSRRTLFHMLSFFNCDTLKSEPSCDSVTHLPLWSSIAMKSART